MSIPTVLLLEDLRERHNDFPKIAQSVNGKAGTLTSTPTQRPLCQYVFSMSSKKLRQMKSIPCPINLQYAEVVSGRKTTIFDRTLSVVKEQFA